MILRRGAHVISALTVAAASLAIAQAPAQAQVRAQTSDGLGGYVVNSYSSDITVARDGNLSVTEQIDVVFQLPRRGIFRYIPWRQPLAETEPQADRYDRRYDISSIEVQASNASPQTKIGREGDFEVIRIGDPDTTVIGPAQYRISYDVAGAIDPGSETVTLVWNAIPARFDVAKQSPVVRVSLPVAPQSVSCTAGTLGSATPCDSAKMLGGGAEFRHRTLLADEGLTITVRFPATAISPAPKLLLEEKFSLTRRLGTDNPGVLAGSGGLLAVLLAGVAKLSRRGRDAAFVRGSTDASVTPLGASGETIGSIPVGPPEYRPPEGLTPAELSFLIEERSSTQQVTATIVDLAVRGHLRIEEIEKQGLLGRADWRFVATPERVKADDRLSTYEQTILTSLFSSGPSQELSELKNQFHTANSRAQQQIEQRAVAARWFVSKPSSARAKWALLGVVVIVAGGALTALAVNISHAGLLAVPLVVAGLAILAVSRNMPSRTSMGSSLTSRALGFRNFLEVADADMLRAAEREGSLDRHLAYASVFGIAEQWTKRLALLGAGAAVAGGMGATYPWWIPSGGRGFDPDSFGRSLSDFTKSAAAVLPSSPSSSGSGGGGGGSVGGGGGGGGGGSW